MPKEVRVFALVLCCVHCEADLQLRQQLKQWFNDVFGMGGGNLSALKSQFSAIAIANVKMPLSYCWRSFFRIEIYAPAISRVKLAKFSAKLVRELLAKFGKRFSSFFCWGKLSETYSTKTPLQISPSNFTTRFWVAAGPRDIWSSQVQAQLKAVTLAN